MARTAKVSMAQQSIWCLVTLRDDTCFSLKFKEDFKGQDVMDQICDKLAIVEKDYFGFQYSNSRGEVHWLNMRNRVSKQLNKPEPYALLFCVKFYVPPHQLLQDTARKQFFLNIKYELLSEKFPMPSDLFSRLMALLAQAEAGDFRENHTSYNPSRSKSWDHQLRSEVILHHCKLKGMPQDVAEFYLMKEFSELEDYGMELHQVRCDDSNRAVIFGIGVECLKVERDGGKIDRVPYTCLRMATHSGKTVKLDVYTSEHGDTENIVYRLNSKEAACALYRSITEHHAFYRCDSIRPAVKEQVARDFFDTVLSWFHDDNNAEQNYIFDTERTCREAYDHARRILYNFGASTAAALTRHETDGEALSKNKGQDKDNLMDLKMEVTQLRDKIFAWKESFHCPVCRDEVVDMVLQCGHFVCSSCSECCKVCPLCRAGIDSKTKCYIPANFVDKEDNMSDDEMSPYDPGDLFSSTNAFRQSAMLTVS